MADYRNIHTRIWTDAWFCELPVDAKLLFVYLFSNPSASVSGLYEIPKRNISLDTGIAIDRVSEILNTFSDAGKVYYGNGVVWVVNLSKYNNSGDSIKIQRCIEKDVAAISNCPVKMAYCEAKGIPYPKQKIPYPENSLKGEEKKRNETRGDESEETPPPSPDDFIPQVSNTEFAPRVFCSVTGFSAIPGGEIDKVLPAMYALRVKYPTDELLTDYLLPYWEAWQTCRTQNGRPYSRTNCAWLYQYAVAEEIPGNKNGNGKKKRDY